MSSKPSIVFSTELQFAGGGPQFRKWFPDGQSDAITFERGELSGSFVIDFDRHRTGFVNKEEVSRFGNISCAGCDVYVNITAINSEIVELFLVPYKDRHVYKNTDAATAHDEICKDVYDFIIDYFNRFVSFFEINKGQYWLEKIGKDTSNYSQFYLKNRIYAHLFQSIHRVFPFDNTIHLVSAFPDERRMVARSDWGSAIEFVRSERRPPLVLQLLS